MKCPNCHKPLKQLKGKYKFAVNIPSSDKNQTKAWKKRRIELYDKLSNPNPIVKEAKRYLQKHSQKNSGHSELQSNVIARSSSKDVEFSDSQEHPTTREEGVKTGMKPTKLSFPEELEVVNQSPDCNDINEVIDFLHTSNLFGDTNDEYCKVCKTPLYSSCPNCIMHKIEQKYMQGRKDTIDEILNEFDNLYAKKKLYLKEQQMPLQDWWGDSEIFSVNELDELRDKIAKEMQDG